jgi:hypothetical protein
MARATQPVAWALGAALVVVVGVAAAATLPGAAREAAAATECRVRGRVLDVHGDAVPDLRVRLALDAELRNLATDDEGRYDFGVIEPGVRRLSVELISQEYAHLPRRFEVYAYQELGRLRSDVFALDDAAGCARDFEMAALPEGYRGTGVDAARWPDLIEIFQQTRRAWALADLVGERVTYGLPLRVYAWCDDRALGCSPDADFAGFAGTRSDGSYRTSEPYIALGEPTSVLGHGDSPDNREYHEVGHFFHANLFGNVLPLHPDNVAHGGYYRNPSSSDSFVEGFAEFYALMVTKHIDGEPSPERYRIRGAEYDVELDQLAWEWAGWWEELALAGVLLDFEDGDQDYRRPPVRELRIESHRVRSIDGGRAVEGTVRNTSERSIAYPEVVVELLDLSGNAVYRTVAPVVASRLGPDERASFVAPLPGNIAYASVRVTPGPLPLSDDDPIDVTLPRLLDAIAGYRSGHEYSNGHVFDVDELYDALLEAFGGSDLDRDGVEDVAQVFRAHGFFADIDGNRRWDGGEAPGLTSHPAFEGYPAALPRSDLPAPPEATVQIDSGGVATHAVVYITYDPPHTSRSYGYVSPLDGDGQVLIATPPRGYDATVTVMLLADGYRPAVAAQFETAELWEYWDQAPGESVIEIEATLQPDRGDPDLDAPLATPVAAGGPPLPPLWAWVVGLEVLIVVVFAGWIALAHVRGGRA